MNVNTRSVYIAYGGNGRKRAFPTSFRWRWKIVSVITLSASFILSIAFQQNLPSSHHHSYLFVPRSSTAVQVLVDPTNLVKIESKKSVEDRAALEELYLLSSLAKKATWKKSRVCREKTPNRKKSPVVNKESKKRAAKFPIETVSNSIEHDGKIFSTCNLFDGKENCQSSTIHEENNYQKWDNSNELPKQVQSFSQTHVPTSASHTAKPKKLCFKGLTTVPNPRNKKKKKALHGSLSERIGIDKDEYIRNLLQKKEEILSQGSDEEMRSFSTVETRSTALYANISEAEATSSELKPKLVGMMHNSRSSTMPGFGEENNTLRKRAYCDGMKVAKQNTRIEFVETIVSRKKRTLECGQAMYRKSSSVPDSLVQFANEIHRVNRITPEEEIKLGEKTQKALQLQHIYDGLVKTLDREPTDDEWCAASGKFNMEAISQIIEEGLQAKNRLVTSNLRMVQGVVNVYIRNGLQGEYNAGDLMQEGVLALIRAAEKFDPSRGFRFSTYAMYWIRSAIKRDQYSQSRIIQIPQRLHETNKKIIKNRKELTKRLNRQPTELELSSVVGITVAQIERCEAALSQRMYSLDQKLENRFNSLKVGDHSETLYSIVASKSDHIEYKEVELNNLRDDLLRALNLHLTEEEAAILILRFGMDNNHASSKKIGRSIVEVSEIVGLKPDKVRRNLKKSLKKLEILAGDDFRSYNRDFCI